MPDNTATEPLMVTRLWAGLENQYSIGGTCNACMHSPWRSFEWKRREYGSYSSVTAASLCVLGINNIWMHNIGVRKEFTSQAHNIMGR